MKTDKTADTIAEAVAAYWKKRLNDELARLLAVAGSQPPLVFADYSGKAADVLHWNRLPETWIRGTIIEKVESDSYSYGSFGLHPRESADETCECGSGSNEVGPGHSSYCRRLGA